MCDSLSKNQYSVSTLYLCAIELLAYKKKKTIKQLILLVSYIKKQILIGDMNILKIKD